jgi:pyridoxamine 5'-phosphate oxidase
MTVPATDPARLRSEYMLAALDLTDVDRDPFRQFSRWFEEAVAADITEPTAMTLATVDRDGRPSARIVLMKGHDARGIVFYTNEDSRKGQALAHDARAALLFHWADLERQVRIEGVTGRVSGAEADAYFASRPRASRIGAWASPQSASIADRAMLEQRYEEVSRRFAATGDAIPRPPNWGGYRVVPDGFEFWQGRQSRLHDRIAYRRVAGEWAIGRLAP